MGRYEKAWRVIESCKTESQLKLAARYIELLRRGEMAVISADKPRNRASIGRAFNERNAVLGECLRLVVALQRKGQSLWVKSISGMLVGK